MRREADDIGPTAELSYWKSRMAKFNKWEWQFYFLNYHKNAKVWDREA